MLSLGLEGSNHVGYSADELTPIDANLHAQNLY